MDLWLEPGECCSLAGATADDRELAAYSASEFMWAKTGRQFGIGRETVRPCRGPAGDTGRFDLSVALAFAEPRIGLPLWQGSCSCSRPDGCSCRGKDWVKLPRDRVREILEVTIDGVLLDSDQYALRGRNRLYRVDGLRWPCCQNLDLETSEEGTWAVRYVFGHRVPRLVYLATKRLACEIIKATVNDPTCRLPSTTRTVAARGISVELARFFDESGTIGIFEVDAAIWAANPAGLPHRATAWSPELQGRAVRVLPEGGS